MIIATYTSLLLFSLQDQSVVSTPSQQSQKLTSPKCFSNYHHHQLPAKQAPSWTKQIANQSGYDSVFIRTKDYITVNYHSKRFGAGEWQYSLSLFVYVYACSLLKYTKYSIIIIIKAWFKLDNIITAWFQIISTAVNATDYPQSGCDSQTTYNSLGSSLFIHTR